MSTKLHSLLYQMQNSKHMNVRKPTAHLQWFWSGIGNCRTRFAFKPNQDNSRQTFGFSIQAVCCF